MSSLMQVRWQRFKQHKLGFSCFIIFSAIFIISLGAELIANDKPLLVKHDHAFYLPILKSYPETTFGGVFETEAEYKRSCRTATDCRKRLGDLAHHSVFLSNAKF